MLNALGPRDLAAPSSGVQDPTSIFFRYQRTSCSEAGGGTESSSFLNELNIWIVESGNFPLVRSVFPSM